MCVSQDVLEGVFWQFSDVCAQIVLSSSQDKRDKSGRTGFGARDT